MSAKKAECNMSRNNHGRRLLLYPESYNVLYVD